MATRKTHGYPVLIIGAGRGGSALLEMFMEDGLVEIVAMVDPDPEARGIKLAASLNIPTYTDTSVALQACKDYPDCIIYNLTHDDTIANEVSKVFANKKVTSGPEAKLFWQMVNNLQRVKTELEKSQSQLQAVIYNAMDGIITFDESCQIMGFNPAAEAIFGYLQLEVLGSNVNLLMPEFAHSESNETNNWCLHSMFGGSIGVRGREMTAIRKNGEQFPMELSASEMVLGGERYFIGIVRDITERKLAEQKILHLAHHDYLTELPNRALFVDRLERAIALAKRNNYRIAVLFLDLDGFKQINDTHGHEVGDLLLQGVADRLRNMIRVSDTAARVGGDEFTIVLNNIGSQTDVTTVANKIIIELSEPFNFDGRRCQVGCSIGVALFPDNAANSATLLRQADKAMYRSKQSGKNTCTFYTEISSETAAEEQ